MTLAENVALPMREHTDLADDTIDILVKIKLEQVGLREHGVFALGFGEDRGRELRPLEEREIQRCPAEARAARA